MFRVAGRAAAVIAVLALYLIFWPGPIAPTAWTPQADPGFTGAFAANDRLSMVESADLGGARGPEDLALAPGGGLYVGTHDGAILRLGVDGGVTEIARLEGRPLGLETGPDGALFVADAYGGLLRLGPEGGETLLVDRFAGAPIGYANDVDIAADGTVYLTDSTTRFPAAAEGSTLSASILDLAEHGRTGRLLAYDPGSRETRLVADGFSFANGIALSAEGDWLALAETGEYRIWRVWLRGPRAGEREILIDNLPGFPDNIERDAEGRFWIGLASPRRAIVDLLAPWPGLRAALFKLPSWLRPGPKPYGALIAINAEGAVVANLQDTSGKLRLITGAQVVGGDLYVSSLEGGEILRMPLASALEKR